jgi:type I restriction enzyme S subunit
MLRVRCDPAKLLPEYLFYWLSSPQGQQYLFSRISQVGVPALPSPLATLRQASLPVPPLPEQHVITHLLSTFDEKIELTEHMVETLEAIGKAIFKHWFIDYEFPNENGDSYKTSGGEMVYSEEFGMEIPKNWLVKPIDEVAHFLNGLAMQEYPAENDTEFLPVIKIRELREGITASSDKASPNIPTDYAVEDGDVLFSWSGSLEVVIWASGRGALNQHLFKVTSKDYPKWFYYYWLLHHLPEYRRIAEGKATTMGHIQRQHLKSSLVLVPDKTTLQAADKILSSVLKRIIAANIESRNLSLIRDLLLPKLMSGNIRVPFGVN